MSHNVCCSRVTVFAQSFNSRMKMILVSLQCEQETPRPFFYASLLLAGKLEEGPFQGLFWKKTFHLLLLLCNIQGDSRSYHNPYMPEQSAKVQKLRCIKDGRKGVDLAAFLKRLLPSETKRLDNACLRAGTQFVCEDLAAGVTVIPQRKSGACEGSFCQVENLPPPGT